MTNGLYAHDIEPQHLRNGFSQTPSDVNIPITPVMPNMPQMENFVSMNGNFDSEGDSPFLSMSSGQTSSMDYDMSNMLELTSPPGFMQEFNDQLAASGKGMVQTPNHISIFAKDSPHMSSPDLTWTVPHNMRLTECNHALRFRLPR